MNLNVFDFNTKPIDYVGFYSSLITPKFVNNLLNNAPKVCVNFVSIIKLLCIRSNFENFVADDFYWGMNFLIILVRGGIFATTF